MEIKSFMGHAEWTIEYGGGTYKRVMKAELRQVTWFLKKPHRDGYEWVFIEPEIETELEKIYQDKFCGVAH